jgi:hypothetical protein
VKVKGEEGWVARGPIATDDKETNVFATFQQSLETHRAVDWRLAISD